MRFQASDTNDSDGQVMQADTFMGMTKVQFIGVIVTFIVLLAGGVAIVNGARTHYTANLAEQNARTIKVLCARGVIIDGLVTASIEAIKVQYADDLKTRPRTAAADLVFLAKFKEYHAQLVAERASLESPCRP